MLLRKKDINPLDKKVIDNLRGLSIDSINAAKSGYPGICLGCAPIFYTLYSNHLVFDSNNPNWVNRDRFVLSAGHASALLYATLHMAGFDIDLEDLKKYRSLGSKTPAYPDNTITPGVDISTGLPGEGVANAVGIALSEKFLHKKTNGLINFNTYVFCSNEDLMEGVCYEACSLAGHLKLSKLILLYDSSNVTMDGEIKNSFDDDIKKRFLDINWDYLCVNDGEDITQINEAIDSAKSSDLPTIIEIKTVIGRYSVNEGKPEVYRGVLEEEDVTNIKSKLNLRDIPFQESEEATDYFRNLIKNRSDEFISNWIQKIMNLTDDDKKDLDLLLNYNESIKLKDLFYDLPSDKELARVTSNKIINSISNKYPFLLAGNSGLSKSTLLSIEDDERNINFGCRDHAMASIANGIAVTGVTPVISTYLTFSDYLKPAIRMAAMMNLPIIYIFTHDSISVGKSGPVYQGIEQLISLRSIPNLDVYRPADANEIFGSYKSILDSRNPSALILSRNELSLLADTKVNEVKNGAYIIKNENKNADVILLSSGEDLSLAIDVSSKLQERGIDTRVVSIPSIERFDKSTLEYKESVLGDINKTFVIEMSSPYSWDRFVSNRNHLFTINQFGESGSCSDLLEKYNFTVNYIEEKIEEIIK